MNVEGNGIMDDRSENEPENRGRGLPSRGWRMAVLLLCFAFFMLGAGQLGAATLTTDEAGAACAATAAAGRDCRTGDGA